MTSEWRHVRGILMQNKGLQESLSWTQCLSFNYFFFCMKWRRIDRLAELLSRIFLILKRKKTLQIFKKKHFWFFFSFLHWFGVKTRIYNIEPVKMNQYWKFQLDMKKKMLTYTIFRSSVCMVWKMVIIQMHICTCYGWRITK